MIAVNWGTTNFRAYKLDAQGRVEAGEDLRPGRSSGAPPADSRTR